MSIFYKKNCPVCDKKLLKKHWADNIMYICDNGCYEYIKYYNYGDKSVSVFKSGYYGITEKSIEAKEFIKRIEYWKENDRYLTEILSGR